MITIFTGYFLNVGSSSLSAWLDLESPQRHASVPICVGISREVSMRKKDPPRMQAALLRGQGGSSLNQKEEAPWAPAFISLCFLSGDACGKLRMLLLPCLPTMVDRTLK